MAAADATSLPSLIHLRNGDCRATLSTAGGAVLVASVCDVPILVAASSPGLATQCHGSEACFPLVPFGGRIEHNGFVLDGRMHSVSRNTADPLVLHGDGWLRHWSVTQVSPQKAVLHLDVSPSRLSPFTYRAEQRIELLRQGLLLSLHVENRGPERLPFGLGFHPYLPVERGCTVQFEAGGVWSERDLHLPGELSPPAEPFDFRSPKAVPDAWINNCYEQWRGRAVIGYASGHVTTLEADPVFDHLMVYKPGGQPGFLCLEPMTHRPNGHADPATGGLALLEPCASMRGSIRLTLQTSSDSAGRLAAAPQI